DVLLLLDVVEHLRSPERFLDAFRRNLDHRPRTLILTTPNVAFAVQRAMLLLGQFNYGRVGILDRTHTRLFTFRSLRRLLRDAGLRIQRTREFPPRSPRRSGRTGSDVPCSDSNGPRYAPALSASPDNSRARRKA